MKIKNKYKIASNEEIAKDIYLLTLYGAKNAIRNPGEFVEVYIPGVFLPRPISVAFKEDNEFWLAYKVIGKGTEILSKIDAGEFIEVLTGCGNGFDLNVNTKEPLIIGGGMGIAPLYYLALSLRNKGINPNILLGYSKTDDIFFLREFERDFDNVNVTTMDGSYGTKGIVTDIMSEIPYDYFYACGPKPMLKAVSNMSLTNGEMSLETRMGCGIGQCKCCSIETKSGMKTLCKDGPVLKKNEIIW